MSPAIFSSEVNGKIEDRWVLQKVGTMIVQFDGMFNLIIITLLYFKPKYIPFPKYSIRFPGQDNVSLMKLL